MLWPLSAPLAFGQDHAHANSSDAATPVAAPANAAIAPAVGPAGLHPVTPGSTAQDATKVLLDQANYWRSQYAPAKAVDALNRVLQIAPQNADALAMLAQVQADRGDMTAAQSALARLRAASPGDPRIPSIYQTLRVGPINKSDLDQARSLASEGRPADAVNQYKDIFKGAGPTPSLATEYYSVLSGTDHGWDDAKKGLAAQVQANPQDMKAQLAYAQLLTYREQTRAEGITRLNQLAANPAETAGANAALRQALLWLPANGSSIAQLQSYLNSHPSDSEVAQHLEAARHPAGNTPQDEAGRVRQGGFADLNRGRLDRAAAQFEAALKTDPNDGDALGGLGIVRLRQGRTKEAKALLDRASAAEPGKRRQWAAALNGASGAGSMVGRQWDDVRRLQERGDYAAAEARLRPLLGADMANTGGVLLLADLQQRNGELQAAESSYRTVLNRQPTNSAAVIGLAGILSREGRTQEADQLYARAESMGARGVGQLRAQQLRQQAEQVSDPMAQAGLYRAAVSADPSNPWVRLELARLLLRERRPQEARAVMQGVGMGQHASLDSIRAGILFANESNDPNTALALIGRVPMRERTADMQRSAAQAQAKAEIGSAMQYYYINRPMARERLLALASVPDLNGTNAIEVARTFASLNDVLGVRETISTSMAANRGMISPDARVAFSGVLLQIGQTRAAESLANSAAMTPGLGPNQQNALYNIQSGIAVRSADRLNQSGRTADAYDQLAPALERTPTNPDLNMALGRLYASNDQPQKALEINEALLRQDPGNMAVRKAAVDAAIQANEDGRARRMIQDALQMWPTDPQVWIMSATLAKADGDNGRALHDYQRALQLRQQQLQGPESAEGPDGGISTGRSLGAAPNILNAPGTGGGYPGQQPGGMPMPLDVPRNTNRSDNDKADEKDTADNDDGVGLNAVYQAEQALPHVELAQARFPYYVPPAPELDSSRPVSDETSGAAPAAPYENYAAPAYTPQSYAPPAYQPQAYPQQSYAPPAYAPAPYQGYAPQNYAQPSAYSAPYAQAPYAPSAYAPAPAPHHTKHHKVRQAAHSAPAYAPPVYAPAPYQPPMGYAPPAAAYPAQMPSAAAVPYSAPYIPPSSMGGLGGGIGGVPDASRDNSGFANPFRTSPSTMQPPSAGILGATAPVANAQPTDALSADISQNISKLQDQMAPTLQAGAGFRFRTGDSGLGRLTEETLPLEGTYSPGVGQLRVQVAPTFLQGGNDDGSVANRARFGTLPLYAQSPTTPASGEQTASGVGLDVTYGWKWISADVGSTPFGFREQNVIGGLELAPELAPNLRLRLDGERRAVTDSVLSYAGTRDDRSGQSWGGVVDNSFHAQLEYSKGGLNLYGGGGYGALDGTNTESNSEWQAAVGGSYPVYRGSDDELRLGLDLDYFGYRHNESFYTFGYGGYFSPQSYFAALIPITYRQTVGNLDWSVGASVGFQTFTQDGGPIFTDASLQSQLVSQRNGTPASTIIVNGIPLPVGGTAGNANIPTSYQGQNATGFAGGLQGEATYKLTPAWSVGGRAGVQHTGNFTEGGGLLFARYALGIE